MRISSKNIFFTSDDHFYHKLMKEQRGFESIEEMNETLIENWNNKIPEDGIVFFLGDFAFSNKNRIEEIANRLNGIIYFVKGNHDKKKIVSNVKKFISLDSLEDIWVEDVNEQGKKEYQHVVLCHYPVHTWNRKHYGSWHLFGHSHGMFEENHSDYYNTNRMIDVGVDCHNLTPISYEEVKEIISNKKIS